MLGKQMTGKLLFKVREVLGGHATMGGRDTILCGDVRQAPPIGDEPLYKIGKYTGKGRNVPRSGAGSTEGPSLEALTNEAELFREEFDDVVLLRKVHRIDFGDACSGGEAERLQYAADADKFLDVTLKMASCTWTLEEHAWLSKRNRSTLLATHAGREELLAFDEA